MTCAPIIWQMEKPLVQTKSPILYQITCFLASTNSSYPSPSVTNKNKVEKKSNSTTTIRKVTTHISQTVDSISLANSIYKLFSSTLTSIFYVCSEKHPNLHYS